VGEGRAVLLISSELPELLALSDRIVTLYRGRVTAEIPRQHATEESVGQHILGG
jgi:ABC-type sugar transport system ATPase subunit